MKVKVCGMRDGENIRQEVRRRLYRHDFLGKIAQKRDHDSLPRRHHPRHNTACC